MYLVLTRASRRTCCSCCFRSKEGPYTWRTRSPRCWVAHWRRRRRSWRRGGNFFADPTRKLWFNSLLRIPSIEENNYCIILCVANRPSNSLVHSTNRKIFIIVSPCGHLMRTLLRSGVMRNVTTRHGRNSARRRREWRRGWRRGWRWRRRRRLRRLTRSCRSSI